MVDDETGDPSMIVSDALLLRRLQDGDAASFEALFDRHYDRVYGLLYRLVGTRHAAEDLAQEVFLRLYRRPPTHAENVSGWLYRVAMNAGYNALRAEARRSSRERESAPPDDGSPEVESLAASREAQRRVRAALARMKRRDAQLLLMRQMGFSYREMAGAVGVAPGSIGTLLNRAGDAFRQAFREVGGEEEHHAHP
jgi:RNA polymerase sigma-70 factor (ECF subfamily)